MQAAAWERAPVASRRSTNGIIVWLAWTLAWTVSYSLNLVPVWWFLSAPFGIHMTFDNYLVAAAVIFVAGLSTTQSAVLRFVVGLSTATTAAWWVTTMVITFVEAFVLTSWLGVSPVSSSGSIDVLPAIAEVASLGILGIAQGLILSRSLRVRVAAAFWVLGLIAALAVTVVLLATGMLARIMSGQSELLAIAAGNAILGLVWGCLTGAMLVALMHLPQTVEAAIEARDGR